MNQSAVAGYNEQKKTDRKIKMTQYTSEDAFNSFKRTLTSADSEYAQDCWYVFKMAVEFKKLYTIDFEEELPSLPWNVEVRQGYMIRQTLMDLAINLKKEKDLEK